MALDIAFMQILADIGKDISTCVDAMFGMIIRH